MSSVQQPHVLVPSKWDEATLVPLPSSYVSHTQIRPSLLVLTENLVSLDLIRDRAHRVSPIPPADPWL